MDIVNVIVSIVILSRNQDSNDKDKKSDDDKQQLQFIETSLWNEILECPITAKQRFNQIANPIKHYLSKQNDKST